MVRISVPGDLPELQEAIGLRTSDVATPKKSDNALRKFTQSQVPEWEASPRPCEEIDKLLEFGIVPVDVSDIRVRYAINQYAVDLGQGDVDAKYRTAALSREHKRQLGIDDAEHGFQSTQRYIIALNNAAPGSTSQEQQRFMYACAEAGFVLLNAATIPAMWREDGALYGAEKLFDTSMKEAPDLAASEAGRLFLYHLAYHEGATVFDARTPEKRATLANNLTAFREAQAASERDNELSL